MMFAYETLMAKAEILGKHLDTDWAYDHAHYYDSLERQTIQAYWDGEITSEEANEICMTGLYDYDSEEFES